MFKKNEGNLDRVIRALLALTFAILAWFYFSGTLKIVFFALALVLLFTAITGFCGLYRIIGVNTCKIKKE